MEYERIPSVAFLASALEIPVETVRSAANRTGIRINRDGSFLIPKTGAQRERFIQWCAVLPQNRAEQLRAAFGIRPRRAMPLE